MTIRMCLLFASLACLLLGCHGAAKDDTGGTAHVATALLDTEWILVELNGRPAIASEPGREAQLTLGAADGRIAGSGGVNRFFGSYKLDGNHLSLIPAGSTMMAGPEDLMKQEQEFTAALSAATGYRIVGPTLVLTAGDKTVATFRAGAGK